MLQTSIKLYPPISEMIIPLQDKLLLAENLLIDHTIHTRKKVNLPNISGALLKSR